MRTAKIPACLLTHQAKPKHEFVESARVAQMAQQVAAGANDEGSLSHWALTRWYVREWCKMNHLKVG